MRGQPGPLRPLPTRGKRLWSPLRPPAGAARPPERPEPVQPQGWRSRVLIARNARGCEGYRADPRQSSFGTENGAACVELAQIPARCAPSTEIQTQTRASNPLLLVPGPTGSIPFTGRARRKAQVNA